MSCGNRSTRAREAAAARLIKGGGRGQSKGGGRGQRPQQQQQQQRQQGQRGGRPPPIPPEILKKNFTEGCYECGDLKHRRSECPKFDARLKKGGFRMVNGRVAPAPGEDSVKDPLEAYFMNLLQSEGGSIEVLSSPPKAPPSFVHQNRWAPLVDDNGSATDAAKAEFPPLGTPPPPAPAILRPGGRLSCLDGGSRRPRTARRWVKFDPCSDCSNCRGHHDCAAEGVGSYLAPDAAGDTSNVPRSSVRVLHQAPALAAVSTEPGTKTVRAVMDSGADASVCPPGLPDLFGTNVVPSPMSRQGASFHGADGSEIPALGQTSVVFQDSADRKRGLHFQVAPVLDPLISIAQMADADHIVMLGKQGGLVYNTVTKEKISLPRVGNKFFLDMKVPAQEEEEEKEESDELQGPAPAFCRPE